MYLGKIVEVGATQDLFITPATPIPRRCSQPWPCRTRIYAIKRKRILLEGEIPSPRNPPPGCPFHPRCRYREERCTTETPLLREAPDATHLAACHYPEKVGTWNPPQN